MDTNVDNNIHKLRLRLIESELDRQRQSADEYIKRTRRLSRLSSKTINHHTPTNLTYQPITPKVLSRQTSYSPIVSETLLNVDRIGLQNEPGNIEHELELRRIQDLVNNSRRSTQQSMATNYAYDPRLNLQPVTEELYSTSNMDDLIDSMARRQLANRRFDGRGYGPYLGISRQGSVRSQQRNNDTIFPTRTPTSFVDYDFLRARDDYNNRVQADINTIRTNSYAKLPPISPRFESNSALYQTKHNYHRSAPLNLPDHVEHLIELPSDIFLTSRTDLFGSSHLHHSTQKTKPRRISKDKSNETANSDSEQSDGENKLSIITRNKSKQERHSPDNHEGFFTEGKLVTQQVSVKKIRTPRQLFKKAAIGIWFFYVFKSRAAKSRLNRPNQTLSATIHKIRIQEILVALHRVYLEPDGPIYNVLLQTINSPTELKDALKSSSKNSSEAIAIIGDAVKNIVSRIVDFMPRDGVLGTSKTSAVSALIQDGNPFPDNYFWQCEKELLEFNKTKLINITKQRAILLLIGVFIFRALVTTLLIKPIKYRLLLGQLSDVQSDNLKILASIMFYVGRRTIRSSPGIFSLAHEWEYSLYRDIDLEPIVQHTEIKSILTTSELSLRVWCEEYIRRIDASFDKELRT